MKLAIISDLHLGDPTSTLVRRNATGYHTGPQYSALAARLREAGPLDYLVLLGDVFDFSITHFSDAYEASKPFLKALAADGLVRELIYVPGNHDFSAWSLTMQESNIINQIKDETPLKDRWSVPAILDARAPQPLTLSGVKRQPGGNYGGLFFDQLGGIVFNVAYPNLYLIEKTGLTTLITHGHYFEGYWSLTSELAAKIFRQDLQYSSRSPAASIEELVAVNFPLNDLASSGLGMAGPLTPLVRRIQADAKKGELKQIRIYLQRLRDYLDSKLAFEGLIGRIKEFLSDKFLDGVIDEVIRNIKTAQGPTASPARYNAAFFSDPDIRKNIIRYLDACLLEQADIGQRDHIDVPSPGRVLFGHTHVPILSTSSQAPHIPHPQSGKTVEFWNTGGWLEEKGQARVPAALFFYDDSRPGESPWSSTLI